MLFSAILDKIGHKEELLRALPSSCFINFFFFFFFM